MLITGRVFTAIWSDSTSSEPFSRGWPNRYSHYRNYIVIQITLNLLLIEWLTGGFDGTHPCRGYHTAQCEYDRDFPVPPADGQVTIEPLTENHVMSSFVLVHGAQHGAWCWHKIVPRLEAEGHDVTTFDLPAHGTDTTPPGEVTLQEYNDRTVEVLDEHAEPVTLVGHSNAGGVITTATEERPAKVDTVVYLSAILPRDGASLQEMGRTEANADSLVGQHMIIDEQRGIADLPDDVLRDAFYADCSAEDVALARSLLRPEPLRPYTEPISTSQDRFGRVPRVYIETLQDNALTPEFQASMYEDRPCEAVYSLETSHSAFLSAPDALVAHLLSV